jgi:hypothetical protein
VGVAADDLEADGTAGWGSTMATTNLPDVIVYVAEETAQVTEFVSFLLKASVAVDVYTFRPRRFPDPLTRGLDLLQVVKTAVGHSGSPGSRPGRDQSPAPDA